MTFDSIVTTLDTDLVAESMLRAVVQKKFPIQWSGRGASGGLAAVVTNFMRDLGVPNPRFTRLDGHLDVHLNAVISASGTCPCPKHAILLTTDEGAARAAHGRPIPLVVRGDKRLTDQWFPLEFLRGCLGAFEHVFALAPTAFDLPKQGMDRPELVVIVERGAHALQRLVLAAEDKLGVLSLRVLEAAEFGHGLHAREYGQPAQFCTVALTHANATPDMSALLRWRGDRGLHTHTSVLPKGDQHAYALATARTLLEVLHRRFEALELDWRHRPLDPQFDTLRG